MAESGNFCQPEQDKSSRTRRLARLMRSQEGAIATRQLVALGYARNEVTTLIARGELSRRHRGVFIDARAPATTRTQLFAALLAAGPTGFFSHRTAAALHGLRPLNVHALELTVVADHTPDLEGLILHRCLRPPQRDELRTRDGLKCSSIPRLLAELAQREPRRELDRLITAAARKRALDPERAAALAQGRPGAPKLRAALAAYRRPTHADVSGLERDFAQWLNHHPEIPAPQRNVRLDDRWEIDFWWPEQRLAVELDGTPYHSLPDDLERDRIKDIWLQRHRIHIVRVTDFRFAHDRGSILEDIHHFLNG